MFPDKRGRAPHSARHSIIIPQAVRIHPAVKAIALHDIPIDAGKIIRKGSVILVQPLNDDTAYLKGEILSYNICTIKELAPGENPESKRDIEVDQIHSVELQSHYHKLPIIWKMPVQVGRTTAENVEDFLRKKKHPIGKAAFVHSAGKKLFYVDSDGTITQLPSGKISFPTSGYGRALSQREAKVFYDAFDEFSYFEFKEHYGMINTNERIFPTENSPSIDEIRQMRIPDCFLLAALQSILTYEDGKKFIKGMIVDHYDGTVSVRLFDPDTGAPFFIRLAKATLNEGQTPLNGHKALWVHIIETAYASVGQKDNEQVGPSAAAVFSGGGHPRFAMKVLTGKAGIYTPIKLSPKDLKPSFMERKSFDSLLDMINILKDCPLSEEDLAAQVRKQIMIIFPDVVFKDKTLKYDFQNVDGEMSPETIAELEKLIHFYQRHKIEYDSIMDDEKISMDKKADRILALLGQEDDSQILTDLFRSAKEELTGLSLTPFSGEYSKSTLEIYDTISDNFDKGNLVASDTRNKEGLAKLGCEALPGIACKHAYSVHGVFPEERIINGEKRKIFYVKARNPWGTMGRSYQSNDAGEMAGFKDDSNPCFSIELNEFVTTMHGFTILKKGSLFYFDKLRSRVQTILQENDFEFSSNITKEELLRNSKLLSELNETFFNMELLHLSDVSEETRERIAGILASEECVDMQRALVLNVLEEDNPIIRFYIGESESKNLHLFNLFKLQEAFKAGDYSSKYVLELKKEIVEMSGHSSYIRIIAIQNEFNALLERKCAELDEDIRTLKTLLEKTPSDIESYKSELPADDYIRDLQMLMHSRTEMIKALLKEIEASKALLQNLGFVLPEELEELFAKIAEEVKPYKQGFVNHNVERFEQDIISIQKSLSALKLDKNEDESASSYRERLNITFENIELVIQDCHQIVIELRASAHPLADDMEKRLLEVNLELNKLKIDKAVYGVGIRHRFLSTPSGSSSSSSKGSDSNSSPERSASNSPPEYSASSSSRERFFSSSSSNGSDSSHSSGKSPERRGSPTGTP